MKNKKGFTLIELLAVIIILGILMLIAIPSVTSYINKSRQNTYIETAKSLLKGTVVLVNSGELDINDENTTYYIPTTCISSEQKVVSPYGEFAPAYILVTVEDESYDYYFMSRDTENIGIRKPVLLNDLTVDELENDVTEINANITVDRRQNIQLYNSDCSSKESKTVVKNYDTADKDVKEINDPGTPPGPTGPTNPSATTVSFVLYDSANNIDIEDNSIEVNICSDSACANVLDTVSDGDTVSLPDGNYYAIPITAPPGYNLPTSPIMVFLSSNEDNVWTFDFAIGTELPSSGGPYAITNTSDSITIDYPLSNGERVNIYMLGTLGPESIELNERYMSSSKLSKCVYDSCTTREKAQAMEEVYSIIRNQMISPIATNRFANNHKCSFTGLSFGLYFIDISEAGNDIPFALYTLQP